MKSWTMMLSILVGTYDYVLQMHSVISDELCLAT